MGETSNFYEKCSSLSKKGDEKSLRTLLQMGISGNKTARVALRKTRNKKLLKTLIDEYLDNIPSEYNAGMILNLAVKVLRKEYLYVYLMEIFHEKKDLKEIGFFKSVKDIPLDKQEQIEVKKYIIDTKDFDIRLISLIAVEEREDILYALLTKAMDDGLDARTTKIFLELNDKEDEGFVTQTFEYLGYVLNDSEVTVRKSSILKIEQSIEELFRTIKKENIEYLQWKLNLKITGFIIERHKYGWLFFYSQITDLSLLFHLDDVVQKLIKRYKLEGEIKVKRFVRTYAEMHMALHETKYIPNLDDLGLDDKKAILSDIYQIDLSDKDERFVEIQFHRIMKREIRDIEKDIENIS